MNQKQSNNVDLAEINPRDEAFEAESSARESERGFGPWSKGAGTAYERKKKVEEKAAPCVRSCTC